MKKLIRKLLSKKIEEKREKRYKMQLLEGISNKLNYLEIAEQRFMHTGQRFMELDNKLTSLKRFLILKEVAPKLLEDFKIDLFDINDDIIDDSRVYWQEEHNIKEIKAWYAYEYACLASKLCCSECNLPTQDQVRVFLDVINKDTVHKPWYYATLLRILSTYGYTDERTLGIFEKMEKEKGAWYIILPICWLFYIDYLYKTGKKEKAKEILHKYMEKFLLEGIENFFSVSIIAEEEGIDDERILKTAYVGKKIEEAAENNLFEKFIKGKKVAIIGNGPQEIGTGNGEKIDSYEVVIRFNDYGDSEEHRSDYGSKVNILSTYMPYPNKTFSNAELVICNMEVKVKEDYIDALYDVLKAGTPVFSFPNCMLAEMDKELDIKSPTSGFRILYYVKKINPELSIDDVFGFSFKDEVVDRSLPHYYDNILNDFPIPHNLIKEKEVLLKLLK